MDANNYFDALNRLREQREWSWEELASRVDIDDALSNSPAPYFGQSDDFNAYDHDDDIVDAEIIDPPGPGVNPLAVVVDVKITGDTGRAEIYRPFYDEKDSLGRPIHFCPFSGIHLQRSCKRCGSSLPRNLDLHTRYCSSCGAELPFSVTMSDVQFHNYWVIYRTDHSGIQLKRFKNFPPSHPARQILTSPYPKLKLRLNRVQAELSIVWRGAAHVQPFAA
ncbi:MAG TPA: hypothetical protein ENH10_10765 [Bacteroidetes bacterium]|nr:hypothetical protein [Bacteroidota bacterium]HEX05614.1 hypothetical protein [Bacteroidota bacterium]